MLELALAKPPASLSDDQARVEATAAAFYEAAERRAFTTARLKGTVGAQDGHNLAPPTDLRADYADGAVLLRWDPGPVNRVLASSLKGGREGLRVAFRIYRGEGPGQPELLATVPLGVSRWRDQDLPIARTDLHYEVWTVLLAADDPGADLGAGSRTDSETLVSAERSDLVTLTIPEHFTLELLGGDEERAEFLAVVGPPETPVASATVWASVGGPVLIGELSTGLVLESIDVSNVETLTTRTRLVVTTDGSVALDPTTRQPRTTQTQVLVPARGMTAKLVHADGETRVLETELP